MPGFNNAISKLILSLKKAGSKDFQIIQIEIFIWSANFNIRGHKIKKRKTELPHKGFRNFFFLIVERNRISYNEDIISEIVTWLCVCLPSSSLSQKALD